MPDYQKLGGALQGAGAWFSGQGPEWERQKMANALATREQEQAEREAREEQAKQASLDLIMKGARIAQDPSKITEVQSAFAQFAKANEGTSAGRAAMQMAQVDALQLPGLLTNEIADLQAKGVLDAPSGSGEAAKFSAMSRILDDGSAIQFDNQGNRYYIAADGTPISDPGQIERMHANAAAMDARNAAQKAGQVEGAKSGAKMSAGYIDQSMKLRRALPQYDEVVRLVNQGAQTGPIFDALPSLREASILMDQLKGTMGIAVVNSATFGALSEKELALAMDTALPTKLSGQPLADWAMRKKEATGKLIDYLGWAASAIDTTNMSPAAFNNAVKRGVIKPPNDLFSTPSEQKMQIEILSVE
jgi:hypothetical protein